MYPDWDCRNTDFQSVRPAELHSAESETEREDEISQAADKMSAGRTDWKSVFRRNLWAT